MKPLFRRRPVGVGILLALLPASPAQSQQSSIEGLTLEGGYTAETMSNLSGGIRQGTVLLDNFGLSLTIDAERLLGWKGASLFVSSLGNQGGSPSDLVGDLQGVSNIDSYDSWQIYEAHVQQSFLRDAVSVLFGLYDLNSEFDIIETGGLFLNSSHGIGPDFSQTGLNGPSIFPTTSLALRVRYRVSRAWLVQAVVLDAVPGDPNRPGGTHIGWNSGEGVLLSGEVEYSSWGSGQGDSPSGRFAIGGYLYSAEFDALMQTEDVGDPLSASGNRGLYVLGEAVLTRRAEAPEQGLSAYMRLGFANSEFNQFNGYVGGGLVYTGPFAKRGRDKLGLAIGSVRNGSQFRALRANSGVPLDGFEHTLEVTYNAPVTERFFLQPDVQYVINPGTDPRLRDALVLGLRAGMSF